MKSGIYNNLGEFLEIDLYDVSRLCKSIVKKITEKNYSYKLLFYEYEKNITRFSPEFEFCLHELGMCLYDPLCTGKDQILFSKDKHAYLLAHNPFNEEYRPKDFNIEDSRVEVLLDFPELTDKNVGYQPNFENINIISEGIIDNKGYVDSSFSHGIKNLAKIELINELITDKNFYDNAIYKLMNKVPAINILTDRPNCLSITRNPDGKYSLEYLSDNNGKIERFIEDLKDNNLLSNYNLDIIEN